MSTSYETVLNGIFDVCTSVLPNELPAARIHQTPPDSVTTPAVVLVPAKPTMRYTKSLGPSETAMWQFELWLLLGKVNEHAATVKAGELVAPDSPFLRALNYAEIDGGYLNPLDATVGNQTYEGRTYSGAKLNIEGCA